MYACFKGIPKRVRQEAFDLLSKSLTRTTVKVLDKEVESRPHFVVRERECCPWGAINFVYGGTGLWGFPAEENCSLEERSEAVVMMPYPSPEWEVQYLGSQDIFASGRELRRFMRDFDLGRLDTLAQLATAMGVEYHQEEDHV